MAGNVYNWFCLRLWWPNEISYKKSGHLYRGELFRQHHRYKRSDFFYWVNEMKPKKLVYGVGINDADYVVVKYETAEVNGVRKRKQVWNCKYYQTWKNMIERCYSAKCQERYPTYRGCTVSDEWLVFSKFKAWMAAQDFEGNHLDKDLLVEGNKVYSAETCVFIESLVNTFIIDMGSARGEWQIGASWHKPAEKFIAHCSNPFTKKIEHLGLFTTEQEAHEAWRKRKLELAHELAAIQTDPRVAKALIDRYSKL